MFFRKSISEICGTCAHVKAKRRDHKITDVVTGKEVFFELTCSHDERDLKTYNSPKCKNGSYSRANIFKRVWIKGLYL